MIDVESFGYRDACKNQIESEENSACLHVIAGQKTQKLVFDIFVHLPVGYGIVDDRFVDAFEFLFIEIKKDNA